MYPINTSRRRLLRGAALAMLAQSGSALCTPLRLAGNLLAASAPTLGGYRALVCIYLSGGNDSFNLLVPRDGQLPGSHYDVYRTSRGGVYGAGNPLGLAHAYTDLIDLGGGYGAHPQAADYSFNFNGSALTHEGIAKLYASKQKLAFIANIGPLSKPITSKATYTSGAPPQLFSHNDQENLWHIGSADPASHYGWGGRSVEMASLSNAVPPCISVAGSSRFEIGQTVFPYSMSSSIGVTELGNYSSSYDQAIQRKIALDALEELMAPDILTKEYSALQKKTLALSTTLAASLNSPDGVIATPYDYGTNSPPDPAQNYYPGANLSFGGKDYSNSLLDQLRMVARMIRVSRAANMDRQIFYVSLGGFDTHSSQMQRHPVLIAQLSQALGWFWNAMNEIGAQNDVTAFTMSDFGRTLASNGDGSDHAWGGVQLAMGGAVKGGQIYGRYPDLVLDANNPATQDFSFARGQYVPTTGVEQMAASLATWLGVQPGNVGALFPNLQNFPQGSLNFLL